MSFVDWQMMLKNPVQWSLLGNIWMWYVYIARCSDNSFYTGITTDIERRIKEHNTSKRGAKYTRSRRPVVLACSYIVGNRSEAMKEEIRIKKMTRKQKSELVERHLKKPNLVS